MKKTKISKMIYFAKSKRLNNVTSNECRCSNIDFRNHSIFDVWMLTWHDINSRVMSNEYRCSNIDFRNHSIFDFCNMIIWHDITINTYMHFLKIITWSKNICENRKLFVKINRKFVVTINRTCENRIFEKVRN